MSFALQVLINTPWWVWLILVASAALGLFATRDREGSVIPYYFLPLMGLISLTGQIDQPYPQILPAYFAAYAVAASLGYGFQEGWIRWKSDGRIAVRGEWLTMVQALTLFAIGYAEGVTGAIAPEVANGVLFKLTTAIFGAFASGLFLGRSIRIIRTPSAPAGEALD